MNNKLTFFWAGGGSTTAEFNGPLSPEAYKTVQDGFKKKRRTTLTFADGVVFHIDFGQVQLVQYEPAPVAPAPTSPQPGSVVTPGGQTNG